MRWEDFRTSDYVDDRRGGGDGGGGIGIPMGRGGLGIGTIIVLTLATIGRSWRLAVAPTAPAPGPRAPRLIVTLERR